VARFNLFMFMWILQLPRMPAVALEVWA